MKKPTASIVDHFEELADPRIERNKKHALIDIIVLTICAVITGSETWEEIEDYGHYKEEWLKSFLPLQNGIPSHDTIRRLFIRLNPDELQRCFMSWIEAVRDVIAGDVIAVDGKTLRRSGDQVSGKLPIHMVSAWAAGSGVLLGQKKTAEKSNEITAIPALLELLKIKGCIVTIDAIGCQSEIAATIQNKKADYVLALKGNQKNLHEDVKYFYHELEEKDLAEEWLDSHTTVDKDHGRIEIREYYQSDEIAWLPELKNFVGAKTIGMVKATRIIGKKQSTECRYYISSLPIDAQRFAHAVRSHWSVENTLHWTLDMTFREDDSRMREGYSAENFAMMRRLALSLMKRDKYSKKSLKRRRRIAHLDNSYLTQMLFSSDEAIDRRLPG
ncbi:hypothetical protein B4O97_19100 [Marispirochaeta aestuarii]|uniref:ISAs1 family transposase n=1 Tax=Marispirochaeta aestuarii TaxID=1963862 RepID=A0A1Y1RST1_9SPIO|nr:ISAs1 family transposase [Marispirochaeta aestuarii]ORC26995.1 hypothetical protein B4O97_19100 [Marispirochaeta aestuarii]